jgi:hypothetical protein
MVASALAIGAKHSIEIRAISAADANLDKYNKSTLCSHGSASVGERKTSRKINNLGHPSQAPLESSTMVTKVAIG